MKYLYCLVNEHSSTDHLPPGLEGEPVYLLAGSGVGALVSNLDVAPPKFPGKVVEQNAVIHQDVVQSSFVENRSTIPCRFGACFPDDESVISLLKTHQHPLLSELARLAGKVEMGVRVLLNDVEQFEKTSELLCRSKPGYYLLEKRRLLAEKERRNGRSNRLQEEFRILMAFVCNEQKSTVTSLESGVLLSLFCLLDRKNLPSFQRRYEFFRVSRPDLEFQFSGPWPPYNFVEFVAQATKMTEIGSLAYTEREVCVV